jgi:sugar lactone lactonase YvrE
VKIGRWTLFAAALVLGYLLFWPTRVDPARWVPPAAPELAGPYAPNRFLAATEWLGKGEALGPEATAIDRDGRIYAGNRDGRVIRFSADGRRVETFTDTHGRPLGMAFDSGGNLLVADAMKGLLSVSPAGIVAVLATEQGGVPFGFPDDVDVAPDGTVYFTDASFKYSLAEHRNDVIEHRPNGRLLAYDPASRAVSLALGKLYFANGVAVSGDGSFVLVCETANYRVTRYWRSGPRSGTADVFIDNLPGFPDNITFSREREIFWLALYAPRDALADQLMPHPLLRKVIARLPTALQPQTVRHAFALGVDPNGKVIYNLQDPSPQSFAPVTSVREHGGILYLGSIERDALGRVRAP